MNRWLIVLLKTMIAMSLSLAICACNSADDELTRYINEIKRRSPKPLIDPIPEFKVLPKFIYTENDKRRSPFVPVQIAKMPSAYMPDLSRLKQPLEAFPLDALQFVGILKEGHLVWGLISQPDGLVSRVRVGDFMGLNYGQVMSIQDQSIVVQETIMVMGQWERKQITLNLRTPK